MWTDNQTEPAEAERASGGRFSDPLFYAEEPRKFWRDIVRTALDVAGETPLQKPDLIPEVSPEEVREFSDHCVHIRSVYEYAAGLFRDGSEEERNAMYARAPLFFKDLGSSVR